MALTLITPPAAEPLSAAEARAHVRVDSTDEDTYLAALVQAARMHVEQVTWRALITQTWRLSLRAFPCGAILLPRPPLQEVESITYLDTSGDEQTLAPSAYIVNTADQPGTIEPAHGQSWPATRDQAGAVQVTFVAGYGDEAADVPADLRHVLRLLVGHFYESREAVVIGTIATALPMAVEALLSPQTVRDSRLRSFLSNSEI